MTFTLMCEKAASLLQRIPSLPFNVALAKGTLPQKNFIHFLEQDALYLFCYARTLSHIASRLQPNHPHHAEQFSDFANNIVKTESTLLEKYLPKAKAHAFFQARTTVKPVPAVTAYRLHLLTAAKAEKISAAIAAVLPCFYLYSELGQGMPTSPAHPYHAWIRTYSNPRFLQSTTAMIQIFNEVTQPTEVDAATTHFIRSIQHEIHFWESCTHRPPHQVIPLHFRP